MDGTPLAREVTDKEVAFFRENGWVHLTELVRPDVTAQLLRDAKVVFGEHGDQAQANVKGLNKSQFKGSYMESYWLDYDGFSHDSELAYDLFFSPQMGANAQRMIGRAIPVRYDHDKAGTKPPGNRATEWHQDFPGYSKDRVGELVFWIALADVTADMGGMRFVSKAHREGPLGRATPYVEDARNLLEQYPVLSENYEMSPGLKMGPGDATVHSALTPHGGSANTTQSTRWSCMVSYFPADALYTGASYHRSNGLGLKPDYPFDIEIDGSPRFPIVFPPEMRDVPGFEVLREQRVEPVASAYRGWRE